MTNQFDLAVLGGGPAGYVAALRAAQLGARTALIEKERVGGTCLNTGCIPTKALTTSTELLLKARRAHEFGVAISTVAPDLPALMAYKQGAVDALVGGVEHLLKNAGVTLLRGTGSLSAPTTLRVQPDTGDAVSVSASHVILAPGSVTARPPIAGLDLPGVITSTEALEIADVPARLIVVGGGVIGLEFACIYEALGSQVTILEMMPTLLPGATDEGVAQRLALLLRRRGMGIVTGAQVEAIASSGGGLAATYRDAKGAVLRVEGDRVLAAVGRWPNTEGLGLAEVGVKMSRSGDRRGRAPGDQRSQRVGHRRRGQRADAGAQGDGRRARGGRERLRRQSQRGLPLCSERHLHATRGRQRRPDRSTGAPPAGRREGRAVPVLGQSASADPGRDGWPGEARVRSRAAGWCWAFISWDRTRPT